MGVQAAITVIGDDTSEVAGRWEDGRALVAPSAVSELFGWELKPEGLCRGDECRPVRDSSGLGLDGEVDLAACAELLDRSSLLEPELGIIAVGPPAEERSVARDSRRMPAITLPDLDGVDHDAGSWAGRKTLLVAFSSW